MGTSPNMYVVGIPEEIKEIGTKSIAEEIMDGHFSECLN